MFKAHLKIAVRNLWKNKMFLIQGTSGIVRSDRSFKHSSLLPAIEVFGRLSLFPRQFLETCNPELSLRVRYITNNNYQTHSKKY
jgi:hypothetical protein